MRWVGVADKEDFISKGILCAKSENMNYQGIFRQWKQSHMAVSIQKSIVPLTVGLEIEGGSQVNEDLLGQARCLDFNL